MGNLSIRNLFKQLVQTDPSDPQTNFGTLGEAYQFTVYFDGQEVDSYQNWLGAVTATYKPTRSLRLKFTASGYQTIEDETYDISAEYWIGKLEVNQGSSNVGQVTEALGVGAFLNHARNSLDGTVFNLEHRGTYENNNSLTLWGIKYQHEFFHYVLNEWEMQDSAGYSLATPA